MMTIRGEIPEELLRKEVIKEKVPCGDAVTTKYFASDGEMVRSDVDIAVSPEFWLQVKTRQV